MGRLTEYTEEIQEKADTYVHTYEGAIPSVAGLSLFLSVNRSTIYKWKDENPVFSDTLSVILLTQEVVTLNKGLDSDFNATIAKLVLANHGYHDKQEVKTDLTINAHESWLEELD